MTDTRFGQALSRGVAIAVVLGLVVAGALWWTLSGANTNRVVAYFPTTTGLYVGNDVRVLGVQMGEITAIEPQGDRVRAEMEYDREVTIPAGAKAVIVAPSLVSDRYVQFAPAYTGGPRMEDGAMVPIDRTEVPLEIDQLTRSLSRVSESLGPNGANANGSLSDLLKTLSENLEGNGKNLNNTITKLGQLSGTLSGNSGDLFKTVENLAKLSTTLAGSDDQVRRFESQLAEISSYLESERENLSATVRQLGPTLQSVADFIESNRGRLKSNVDKLASITQVLVDQRAALAEIADIAPVTLGNLYHSYNASSGTLDARPNLNELTTPPLTMICGLIEGARPELNQAVGNLCDGVVPILEGAVPLPSLAQVATASNQGAPVDLPLPVIDVLAGGGGQ